jgi:hypothetical protein
VNENSIYILSPPSILWPPPTPSFQLQTFMCLTQFHCHSRWMNVVIMTSSPAEENPRRSCSRRGHPITRPSHHEAIPPRGHPTTRPSHHEAIPPRGHPKNEAIPKTKPSHHETVPMLLNSVLIVQSVCIYYFLGMEVMASGSCVQTHCFILWHAYCIPR